MKRYENPIMNVSLFDAENIVTESSVTITAYEQAKLDAANVDGSQDTFTVKLTF